jgi:hypothetical protein
MNWQITHIVFTAVFIAIVVVAYFLAWHNYRECRTHFSRYYCATTTLVR